MSNVKTNIRNNFIVALKAFVIGSTMTVPGVSGGSMAMILGEYDKLISSIPGLLKKKSFKKSFIYLAIFFIFGVLGIFIASKPLTLLLSHYYDIVMYFFIGAVVGTVPMMVKQAKIERIEANSSSILRILLYLFFIAIGIAIVYSIELLPEGVFSPSLELDFKTIVLQLLGGTLISIGFVLPGISTSYLLVVLGLYKPILNCISTFDVFPLIPIAIGVVIGTFALTGFLTWAMKKHPKVTYMIILGFLIGSVAMVFPGIPSGLDILFSIVTFVIGFVIIYKLSKAEAALEIADNQF